MISSSVEPLSLQNDIGNDIIYGFETNENGDSKSQITDISSTIKLPSSSFIYAKKFGQNNKIEVQRVEYVIEARLINTVKEKLVAKENGKSSRVIELKRGRTVAKVSIAPENWKKQSLPQAQNLSSKIDDFKSDVSEANSIKHNAQKRKGHSLTEPSEHNFSTSNSGGGNSGGGNSGGGKR